MQKRTDVFATGLFHLSLARPASACLTSMSFVCAVLALASGCGLVNGLGGPWPPSSSNPDGGDEPLTDGGACTSGAHNGGDGTCVPEGECVADFFVEEDGRCSTWATVATLSPARTRLSLTALTDGRVLAVGGIASTTAVPDASLFLPETDTWDAPSGTVVARYGHRAIRIAGNRVLIVGGRADDTTLVAEGAFYRADQDSLVAGNALLVPREEHALVELPGSRIFVVGGRRADGTVLASVEELVAGQFQGAAFSLATGRAAHEVVALPDGRGLVIGGVASDGVVLASVEAIDPTGGTSTVVTPMTDARHDFTATLLANGRVLVVGGSSDEAGGFAPLRTAEVYDPVTDAWSDAGFLSVPRTRHGAALLSDGRVLVVGGFGVDDAPLRSVEIFDPSTGAFVDGPSLSFARGRVSIAPLADGGALVVQGSSTIDDTSVVTTTERYRIAD
jgi:hypothetical protein